MPGRDEAGREVEGAAGLFVLAGVAKSCGHVLDDASSCLVGQSKVRKVLSPGPVRSRSAGQMARGPLTSCQQANGQQGCDMGFDSQPDWSVFCSAEPSLAGRYSPPELRQA